MGKDESVFEGRNLDDAVRKGLEALGLSRAEVVITVIEEGSGGFLGLGSRPYRVRVVPRPGGAISEPDDRMSRSVRGHERKDTGRGPRVDRRGGGRRDDRPRREGPREVREGRGRDRHERPSDSRRGRDRDRGPQRVESARPAQAPPPAQGPTDDAARSRRRRRRGGRGRPDLAPVAPPDEGRFESRQEARPSGENPSAFNHADETETVVRNDGPVMAAPELEEQATRLTRELFSAMGYEVEVQAHAEGDRVDVRAGVSADEEHLTGRKGEVRQALQHILNRMINHGGGSAYHLQLEINDFWERREIELRELARQLADDAVANRSETVTEYLNAQERRVVHVALKEDTRVKTYALGTGLIKRVAVAPADFPEQEEDEE